MMAAALLAWAFIYQVWILLIVLIPMALASSVFRIVVNSSLSMGISFCIDSLTRIIAPTTGGFILGYFGSWAPGILSGVLLILFIPYA